MILALLFGEEGEVQSGTRGAGLLHPGMFMVFEAGLTPFHILEEFIFDRVDFLAFLSQIPS